MESSKNYAPYDSFEEIQNIYNYELLPKLRKNELHLHDLTNFIARTYLTGYKKGLDENLEETNG